MKSPNITVLAGGFAATIVQQIAQGKNDRGLLIGSTTHLIGSTEGFIGNRLPATT